MRIVVIGGTNFIGPYVVRSLAEQGHQVVVFHRGEHEVDLPNSVEHIHSHVAGLPVVHFSDDLKKPPPDVVLHMFPVGQDDSRALMEAFRGIAKRVVAISSGDVYRAYSVFFRFEQGHEPGVITEDSPLRTVYYPHRDMADRLGDWTKVYEKILVERVVMSYKDLPGTILRLPAVYGPNDHLHRFSAFLQGMQGERPALLLGEEQADWRWTHGYVEDVAHAIAMAVLDQRAANRIYNVGEPNTPTMEQRLRDLAEVIGWNGEIVHVPQSSLPPEQQDPFDYMQNIEYNTDRIRRELGYKETTAYRESLRRTAKWELSHLAKTSRAAHEGGEAA